METRSLTKDFKKWSTSALPSRKVPALFNGFEKIRNNHKDDDDVTAEVKKLISDVQDTPKNPYNIFQDDDNVLTQIQAKDLNYDPEQGNKLWEHLIIRLIVSRNDNFTYNNIPENDFEGCESTLYKKIHEVSVQEKKPYYDVIHGEFLEAIGTLQREEENNNEAINRNNNILQEWGLENIKKEGREKLIDFAPEAQSLASTNTPFQQDRPNPNPAQAQSLPKPVVYQFDEDVKNKWKTKEGLKEMQKLDTELFQPIHKSDIPSGMKKLVPKPRYQTYLDNIELRIASSKTGTESNKLTYPVLKEMNDNVEKIRASLIGYKTFLKQLLADRNNSLGMDEFDPENYSKEYLHIITNPHHESKWENEILKKRIRECKDIIESTDTAQAKLRQYANDINIPSDKIGFGAYKDTSQHEKAFIVANSKDEPAIKKAIDDIINDNGSNSNPREPMVEVTGVTGEKGFATVKKDQRDILFAAKITVSGTEHRTAIRRKHEDNGNTTTSFYANEKTILALQNEKETRGSFKHFFQAIPGNGTLEWLNENMSSYLKVANKNPIIINPRGDCPPSLIKGLILFCEAHELHYNISLELAKKYKVSSNEIELFREKWDSKEGYPLTPKGEKDAAEKLQASLLDVEKNAAPAQPGHLAQQGDNDTENLDNPDLDSKDEEQEVDEGEEYDESAEEEDDEESKEEEDVNLEEGEEDEEGNENKKQTPTITLAGKKSKKGRPGKKRLGKKL